MTIYTKDFDKDPNAVKDYAIDWSLWLDSDTVITSDWDVPTGLTGSDEDIAVDGLSTSLWLEGGTLKEDYDVTNTVTTAGGRTEVAILKIRVR